MLAAPAKTIMLRYLAKAQERLDDLEALNDEMTKALEDEGIQLEYGADHPLAGLPLYGSDHPLAGLRAAIWCLDAFLEQLDGRWDQIPIRRAERIARRNAEVTKKKGRS